MHKRLFFKFLIFALIIACKNNGSIENYSTYLVKKKDFLNTITVGGTLISGHMVTVACPGVNEDLRIVQIIEEGASVHKGDTVCILRGAELENQFKDAVKNLNLAISDLEKNLADQSLNSLLLESQVKNFQSTASILELDSINFKFYTPSRRKIAQLNIEKARIQKEKNLRKLNFMKIVDGAEIQKLNLKIGQETNRVKFIKEKLGKLVLTSPANGYVEYAWLWSTGSKAKKGDVVWGIMPILNVADMSSMQVKLIVNDNHFKRIQKGQSIDISIDAFTQIKLKGKITTKPPVGKPIREKSQVKVFEILSSVDSTGFSIQPGLSVTCKIYLDKIPDTTVVPLTSVYDFDTLKVVYVKLDGKIKRRSVKTGINSDTEIIINQGLKPNEVILIPQPPENIVE